MFRKLLDEGRAGDNIGALLRGTKKEDVERGQVLCKPGSITPAHQLRGQRLRPDQGGGWPPQAVLQQLPAAVLLPHHRRDRLHHAARGHRDGHARRQHRDDGGAAASRSPWTRDCASPSARVAAPSAPAASPRSSSSGQRSTRGRRPMADEPTPEDPDPAEGLRPRDPRPVDREDRPDRAAHPGQGPGPGARCRPRSTATR